MPEICGEEIAEELFYVFCFDVCNGARTLALRLISLKKGVLDELVTSFLLIINSNYGRREVRELQVDRQRAWKLIECKGLNNKALNIKKK